MIIIIYTYNSNHSLANQTSAILCKTTENQKKQDSTPKPRQF